ncbi:hypothetical protein C6I20_12395 [Aeromicrobium sp. A1-2]|nr:hypothetical protein C6I20_12395 [Aeromicrobium sp. A1-2]
MIIAFVVAVWAAYFVPLVLRRYDDASKNASIDTSGTLGRVIARSTPATKPTVEIAESAPIAAAPEQPAARNLDRPAARLAAKRRRRTLLTLLALAVVVTGLSVLSVIGSMWIVAPVVLIGAWLTACRIQVRGELGLGRLSVPQLPPMARVAKIARAAKTGRAGKTAKTAKTAKSSPSLAAEDEETIIVSGHHEDINPGRKHQMEDVPLEVDALEDQIVIAVPSVSTTGEALWDPLPVTLPTYVTKPRAGRTVRTIEFGQAGAWTSGHIEGEDVELPHRAEGADEQRRAVGH